MVWTGRDVLVWGVRSDSPSDTVGARLALDELTWRPIARAPLPPLEDWDGLTGSSSTVWTGTEMLVWAPWSQDSKRARWLAYNPDQDSWRELERPSVNSYHPTLRWTGDTAVVVAGNSLLMQSLR